MLPAEEGDVYNAGQDTKEPKHDFMYSTRPPPANRQLVRISADRVPDKDDAVKRGLEMGQKLGCKSLHRVFRTATYWVLEFSK
jgi:hypothetical protein